MVATSIQMDQMQNALKRKEAKEREVKMTMMMRRRRKKRAKSPNR